MLHSMTGFGHGAHEADGLSVRVEIKSVNGRFLKVSQRLPNSLAGRENAIESLIKGRIRRGSVTVTVVVDQQDPAALVSVNEEVVRAYQTVFRRLGLSEERIPTLPGVLGGEIAPLGDDAWKGVEKAVEEALARLIELRQREGRGLAQGLDAILKRIAQGTDQIAARAPAVVLEYQGKLQLRLEKLLEGRDLPVEPEHLVREVAIMADRSDLTEEIDRLRVHLRRAMELLQSGGEVGRTLEFVAQEMHREVNTIGSKSGDAQIAHLVVDLKGDIEKVKEQVANLE